MKKLGNCIACIVMVFLFLDSHSYAANKPPSASVTTLPRFLKNNSINDAVFSKNGECLATQVKASEKSSMVHLWDLTQKDYPLIKALESLSYNFSLKSHLAFSRDGKMFAYMEGGYEKTVYFERFNAPDSKFKTVFTDRNTAIDINHDGSQLVRSFENYGNDRFLVISDSKTGKALSPEKKGLFINHHRVLFNDYGPSVAIFYSYNDPDDGIKKQAYLFGSKTMNQKEWFAAGQIGHLFFLPENQFVLSGTYIEFFDDKSGVKLLSQKKYANAISTIHVRNNSEAGIVQDNKFILMSLAKDSRFKKLKEAPLNHTPLTMHFLENQNKWMFVSQKEIEYVAPLSDNIVKANASYSKGLKMLRAGFLNPGMKKLIKAVEENPTVHADSVAVDLAKKDKFPLYIAGQVLLKQHKLCWQNNPKESLQALFNYAYIAANSGQSGLTRQVINEILRLNHSEPGRVPEENIKMMVTGLEALVMAIGGDPNAAYDHMIENDGIFSEDYTDVRTQILSMPRYWAPFYSDRKKLAYLLDVEPHELPKRNLVKAQNSPPQSYPDLNGNIINPPGAANAPATKTEQKKIPADNDSGALLE